MPKRAAFCSLCVAAVFAPTTMQAQQDRWAMVHQPAAWYGAFIDRRLTDRLSLWFDGQWRRSGLVMDPQQLLLRPGVQWTLTPGARVGAGYAWIATAPYGEAPLAAPVREHRVWQQLALSQRVAGISVSHRYRWEQRWLSSLLESGATPPSYQQRARYMVRAQGTVRSIRINAMPLTGFVWNEVLMPVGHGDPTVRLTQNRIGAGFGVPMRSGQRIDVGYMNLWNGLSARRTNEVNHTLTLSWIWN